MSSKTALISADFLYECSASKCMLHLLQTSEAQRQQSAYIETLKSANPVLLLALHAARRVWGGAYEPLLSAFHISSEEAEIFRQATSDPKRLDAHINWYRANFPAVDDILPQDYWPSRNARLTMPALLIWGAEDGVFSEEMQHAIAQRSDNLRVLKLEGAGHWPHIERASEVNEALKGHLRRAAF